MNPDTELLNTRLTVNDAKITKAEKEIKALKGRDMSYLKKPEICAEIDKLRAEKKELTDHNRELTQQIANLGVSAFQAAQAQARKRSGSDSRSSSSAQSYKEAKKSVLHQPPGAMRSPKSGVFLFDGFGDRYHLQSSAHWRGCVHHRDDTSCLQPRRRCCCCLIAAPFADAFGFANPCCSRLDGWRTHWLWSDIHRVQGHQGG